MKGRDRDSKEERRQCIKRGTERDTETSKQANRPRNDSPNKTILRAYLDTLEGCVTELDQRDIRKCTQRTHLQCAVLERVEVGHDLEGGKGKEIKELE